MFIKGLINELIDLALPEVCHFCGNHNCDSDIAYLCKKCAANIPFRSRNCRKVSCLEDNLRSEMAVPVTENFTVIAACYYEDPIRHALIRMKFYDESYHYREFAHIVGFALRETGEQWDMIIPVPLHKSRQKERGYNQTLLIASELSDIFGIELKDDLLIRSKNTARQSEAGTKEKRIANLHDAFSCTDCDMLMGKKVLLLDDVLTSGATMFSAANCITNKYKYERCNKSIAGVPRITGIVIASDR